MTPRQLPHRRDHIRPKAAALLVAWLLLSSVAAQAVILLATDDPNVNTTEPTGTLAGSGWQYEGGFGWANGTAISPHHFLTVKHVDFPSTVFVLDGVSYTITQWYDDPGSELRIVEVVEPMPTYAPLYSRTDELQRGVVVIGRGTRRGNPVYLGGSLRGWDWGSGDSVQRWGENQVARADGYALYATFDQGTGPNEAHLSSGDSGGAMFINDGGTWKLAGINHSVDGPFSTALGGGTVNAVLFDARGFYTDGQLLISSATAAPTGFYAMRISARLPWITSVIGASLPTPPPPDPTPTPAPSATPIPPPPPPVSNAVQMIGPVAGTLLTSSSQTFSWSGGSITTYWLYVGRSPGASDVFNSGSITAESATVANVPTAPDPVYARLWSRTSKTWTFTDYSYNGANGTASSGSRRRKQRPH